MKEVLEEIGVKIEWNEYKECAMSNIRQITVSHGEIIEDITIPKEDFLLWNDYESLDYFDNKREVKLWENIK